MRDRFQCRYCGARLLPASLMELIHDVYPKDFPFHRNWKGGETHPAFVGRSLIIDHVEPVAHGGHGFDRENLATSCWPCNARKADFTLERLDWELRTVFRDPDWDGLTSYYPPLWQEAGRPK